MTLDNLSLLISRETPLDPPQYFVRTWPAPFDADVANDVHITDFPHPYPALRHLQKARAQSTHRLGTDQE